MKNKISFAFIFIVSALFGVLSCKKTDFYKPPFQAHFIDQTGKYLVEDTSSNQFVLNFGLTQPATADTKVSVSVSSPTGAVLDSQYTLSSNTITIPAGQTLGSIVVKGIFAAYATSGRVDTLIFNINNAGTTGEFNQTYILAVQKNAFWKR